MTNSYMTDPAQRRKFLLAHPKWAKSVSLTGAEASSVRTGLAKLLYCAVPLLMVLCASILNVHSAFGQTVTSLPYSENFQGPGASASGNWTVPSTLTPAWSTAASSTTNELWQADNYTTGWTSGTGSYTPSGANSTTRSARFHTYDAQANTFGELYSPTFDMSAIPGNKALSFYYINTSGSDVLTIAVSTDGGTTWSASLVSLGVSTAWTLYTIPLGNVTSNNFKFKFRGTSDYGTTDIGIDEVSVFTYSAGAYNYTATAIGGLWSSPATWTGGVIPAAGIADVTIPAGSIVTVDQVVIANSLSVSGVVQWNGTANAMTLTGDLTINSGGRFLPHTTAAGAATSVTTNIGGNLTNNGYANFYGGYTTGGTLNFNGAGSTISGSGTFEGNGTDGYLRTLFFQNLGSNAITTTQKLVTPNFGLTGGTLNTNGNLTIDGSAQVTNRAVNYGIANAVVTNMGTGYTTAPFVSCNAAALWATGVVAVGAVRINPANGRVYVCIVGGTATAGNAPTVAVGSNETTADAIQWICVGNAGDIGTALAGGTLTPTAGTQYFFNGSLFTCVTAAAMTAPNIIAQLANFSSAAIGGTVTVGTTVFRRAGSVAQVSLNHDATSGTVRSLNIVSNGSGYSSTTSPGIVIVANTTGSGAAATAVVPYYLPGRTAGAIVTKSSGTTVSGVLNINSDGGAKTLATLSGVSANNIAQSSAGVSAMYTTAGGNNYTVAPTVGFAGPTALNLVTNAGSGYTSAPTVTVSGGTLISGTALTTSNFTITMNRGKVVSVYLNASTSACYSVPPTLSFSTGTATLAWPTGCWPAATASIGSNGQITNFTVTNSGYGYVAAPTCGVGTVSGTAAGGTFTTVASAPTAVLGLYNLTVNYFTPSTAPATQLDDAFIPSTRKMTNLTLAGNANGIKLTSSLTLYGTSPLSLTASNSTSPTNGQEGNVIDMGGNNLYFSWPAYGGTTSTAGATKTYLKNGSMTLTTRGGGTAGNTLNFPFLANAATGRFQVVTGTGTGAAEGSDILAVKVTELGAATNTGTPVGTGLAVGNRSYQVETSTYGGGAGTSGTNPSIRLNWNNNTVNGVTDGITTTQDQTFVGESVAASGPWTVRSNAVGVSGSLAATGEVQTPTIAPGPIALVNGNYYSWVTGAPTITSTSIDGTTVCANSAVFTITGTNLSGVTAVAVGGTAVTSFTVNSNTQITATVGTGTTGVVSVTKNGATASGSATITVLPSPDAPTLTQASYTGAFGSTQSITASGAGGTFNWYNVATGGTAISTGDTYSVSACATGSNYWVAENNGTCEGARAQVSVTVSPAIAVTASPSSACAAGTTVSLSTNVTGATFAWTANNATLSNASDEFPTIAPLKTAEAYATITKGACVASTPATSVGVYAFPSGLTPSATPDELCAGTSTTLATGLAAGSFTVVCETPSIRTVPTGASPFNTAPVTLVTAGTLNVPLTNGNADDGGWGPINLGFTFNYFGTPYTTVNIGTNNVMQFGAFSASTSGGLGDYTIGALPNTADPKNAIFFGAHDATVGTANSNIKYWTEGAAPNRRFVLDYNNTTLGNNTNVLQMQIILYETTGQVEIIAKNIVATAAKTIGVNSPDGTIGGAARNCSTGAANFWNATTSTVSAASPQAWKFIPGAAYAFNWTNTANTTVANAGTGQLYGTGTGLASPVTVSTTSTIQTPDDNITYRVYIQDPITSCANTYDIPVSVTQVPAAPTTSYGAGTPLVMCGTQVPASGAALVSCPTCGPTVTYNWYNAATGGSLFQGSISENFNSGVNPGTFTLVGNAALQNTRCELTQAATSQFGALQLGSTGVNTNAYEIDFDLRVDLSDNSGGADGMSYSFGDNVVATAEAGMNAENGTGNKLKVAFVTYTNGSSPAGIYLMYNCTTNEQTTTTSGVLAYSNSTAWKNTTSDVHVDISINASGQVTLLLDGVAPTATVGTFSGAQLPLAYLAENKATWQHVFKARTGAAYSRCAIDNMIVASQPAQNFEGIVQSVSASTNYYVQSIVGICGSTTRTEVALQVDAPPAFAVTTGATACPYTYTPITVTVGDTSYTQFTWSPVGLGLLFNDAAGTQAYTGDSRDTVYVYAATPGSTLPAIYCNALDTNGPVGNQCANQATSILTVGAVPAAPVITASSLSACNGSTITLSAAAAVSYSTPSVSSPTADEDISLVRLGQSGSPIINNASSVNTLVGSIGTATGTAGGYANYTAFGPFTFNAAIPVDFQLSSTNTGSAYDNALALYIDYNQDGDFADAGENAYVQSGTVSGPQSVSGSFNIPASALNGTTRMRVLCNEGSITGPTMSVFYGEWEDYSVTITGGVSYTYAWTGGIASTAQSVTSPAITAATNFSATVSQGGCYSAPSNVIAVAVATAPTIAPIAVAASNSYSTPSVSVPQFDEDVDLVRLQVDFNNDTIFNTANGDYNVFTNTSSINSLIGSIGTGSGTAGGYSNFTNFGPYTLDASYQHRLQIRSTDQSGFYDHQLGAWIDFNQDGDFVDAGEQIILGAPTNVPHTRNSFFYVPANAKNGLTRMRVVVREGTTLTGPTNSVSYGEWEDYTLNIINATTAVPCPGSQFNLNAQVVGGGLPYASYTWAVVSGNATLSSTSVASPVATVNGDATFSVTLLDACGLSVSDTTATVDILENTVAVTPVDPIVCGNPGTTFTATGGSDYTWTPSGSSGALNTTTGATVIASPLDTVQYVVTGLYGAGCVGTDTTTLIYTAPPAITITNEGPDQDINCGYGPVYQSTLHATSAATYTYTWSNGSGASAADSFTPGANGFLDAADDSSYVVTLTAEEVGGSGCYSVSQRAVSVFGLPTPTMTATPAAVVIGGSSVLSSGVAQGNFSVTPCGPTQPTYNRITPPASAVTLVTGGVATPPTQDGSLDDGGWASIPIGFTFNFFGTNYTSLNVGTNGVVQFGAYNEAALSDFTFSNPLPSAAEPTNIIALCAVDLYLATSGTVSYWVDGIAPNRKFILDFFQVPGFTTNGLQTVQLQLSETTGLFEIHLGQATSTSAKTIGVNNANGTIGATAQRCEGGQWNSQTGTSTTAKAWRFIPPVDYTFAWSPAGEISSVTDSSVATALPTAEGVRGFELLITDNISGCSNAANPDSVFVTVLPVPAAPAVVGFGESSLVDGTNTIAFCGEQDIQAFVDSTGYPASQYGQALTWSVNWYTQAVGGTPVSTSLQDTIIYGFTNDPAGLSSDDTLYVAVYNGFGESARTMVVLDYETPPAITVTNSNPLNCGPATLTYQSTLSASSANTNYVYTWGPSASLDVTTGSTVVATLNNTVNVTLNADDGYCHADIVTPVSRYDFPAVTPTAANDSICAGGTTTLNSNTSSTGFTITSTGYSPNSQVDATTLVQNGVSVVPTSTGGLDDGLWQNIPIGFNFDFLGNNYTTCAISTNGNIQFGPTFSTSYTPTFGTSDPNNFVALFWADLNFNNGGGNSIRYWTSGIAPNRIFSVRMDGTRFGQSGSSRLTGQIDLYETTGIVRTHLQTVTGTDVTIIGAEDLTGTIGSAVTGRNGDGWTVTTPEAWQFNPPVNYSYAWTPSSEISGSATGATATAAPSANTTYQLLVTDLNTGCDNSVNQQAFVTVTIATAAPATNFIADDLTPSTGGVLQTVNFTTTTPELGPTTYAWTFTPNNVTFVGGTTASSRDPQVQFQEPGQYTCELVMTTCTGTTTKTRTNYIDAYAEYCQPVFGTGDGFTGCNTGYGIGNVTIFSPAAVTVMNHTSTGCISPAAALGYADYSTSPVNGVTTCTMYQGSTYTMQTTSLSPTSNMFFAAYLDVDNDGDFNDPLEFLGYNTVAASTDNFDIGIPTANVSYGLHKLRVVGAFGTGALGANSSCIVTTFGEAHDYVVNIQPPVILNDIPAFASLVQYSVNQNYPNCYPITGTTAGATNSPETASITGSDIWYRFVAQSTGVSITLTSTAFDDAIALYSRDAAGNYNLVTGGYENAGTGAGDFERLNVGGLTPGTTYYIAVGSNSGSGAFQLCVQHLMKSWCAYTIPAGGFSLCDAFKAVYRGAPSQGVTYAFTFTPTGATAGTATTLSGTNGLITLSNPTLALRYAGTYNARVDVTYALLNSAGTAEPIVVSGVSTDPNCTGTNIRQHVLMEVRSTQRCPATLLRTNSLIGASVPGSTSSAVCAATSYTYEFTPVVSCADGTVQGLVSTYNTAAGTPYLGLGVLTNLPNTGAWDVRIRPNFSYGAGTYGPTQRIQVNNTAASSMLDESGLENGNERTDILTDANLYPNPNSGDMVNINITGIQGNDVFVRVLDATGRVVYTNRYVVEGSLNTVVNFAQPLASGVYNVEFTVDGQVTTERMIVAKQ